MHGQLLHSSGGHLQIGEVNPGRSAATNAQERPALAYDAGRGRFLVAWGDHRHQAGDIYGQIWPGYSVVVDYAYDRLYRLVGATYSDGTAFGYGYDPVGNRIRYSDSRGEGTTYQYDAANRLVAVTRAGVTTPYTWSERGELLADGEQAYSWDAAGRLVGVSGPGRSVVYSYDGENERLAMTVNEETTAYVVDPFSPVDGVSQVLRETGGQGARAYLYGLDLLGHVQDGVMRYYGYDALSVRLHLEAGTVVATYRYGPFGEEVGAGPAGYGYAGERWDGAVGLLYLRARYYRPAVGRFVSRDPWPGNRGRPQSLNRYIYALNQVPGLRDPQGLCAFTDDLGLCFRGICGPDVSAWFLEEIAIHWGFAVQHAGWYVGALEFADYARAIPYKWMIFRDLVPGCPFPRVDGALTPCAETVTLCGKCIDRSELGNILFGMMAVPWELPNWFTFWGAHSWAKGLQAPWDQAAAGVGYFSSHLEWPLLPDWCDYADCGYEWATLPTTEQEMCALLQKAQGHWRGPLGISNVGQEWRWENIQDPVRAGGCQPCPTPVPLTTPHTNPAVAGKPAGKHPMAGAPKYEFYTDQIPTGLLDPWLVSPYIPVLLPAGYDPKP